MQICLMYLAFNVIFPVFFFKAWRTMRTGMAPRFSHSHSATSYPWHKGTWSARNKERMGTPTKCRENTLVNMPNTRAIDAEDGGAQEPMVPFGGGQTCVLWTLPRWFNLQNKTVRWRRCWKLKNGHKFHHISERNPIFGGTGTQWPPKNETWSFRGFLGMRGLWEGLEERKG